MSSNMTTGGRGTRFVVMYVVRYVVRETTEGRGTRFVVMYVVRYVVRESMWLGM